MLERLSLADLGLLARVLRVDPGHRLPGNIGNGFPSGNSLCEVYFGTVHARHMVNDHADGADVRSLFSEWPAPLSVRQFIRECGQFVRALLDSVGQYRCTLAC